MKTLVELAREALDVQDACNLSGVVHGWSRAIKELRRIMPTAGTEAINRHPINKMWVGKCADLAAYPQSLDDSVYEEAYLWCKDLIDRTQNAEKGTPNVV